MKFTAEKREEDGGRLQVEVSLWVDNLRNDFEWNWELSRAEPRSRTFVNIGPDTEPRRKFVQDSLNEAWRRLIPPTV